MSEKKKENVLSMRGGMRGWKKTKNQHPCANNEHVTDYGLHAHLWLDWDDEYVDSGKHMHVCASMYSPASEPDEDELVRVPLDAFIYEGALWLLGMHKNKDGALSFTGSHDLAEFNQTISNLAAQLEDTAKQINKLKIREGDLVNDKWPTLPKKLEEIFNND